MSDVSLYKVYLYDHVRELRAYDDNFCLCKDTGPMNTSTLKAHKGVDNKLIFRVLNPDRSPNDVAANQEVYGRIVNTENRTVVLEKLCRLGPAKGLITLELNSGDLADVAAGLYEFVLIRTQNFVENIPGYYVERPLYVDMGDNIAMELEITEQAFKAPLHPTIITTADWVPDIIVPTFGPPTPCFYTSRIPGARVLNHKESVHTFSTYTENATGVLEIWGTLEETPDAYLSSTRWCKIYPSSMSYDIEFFGYTGTQAWTFQANFMWLKFRWFPSTQVADPGSIKKLVVRT